MIRTFRAAGLAFLLTTTTLAPVALFGPAQAAEVPRSSSFPGPCPTG